MPALGFVIASRLLVLRHCDLLPGVMLFLALVVAWVACFLSCSCSASALCPLLWLFLRFSFLLSVFLAYRFRRAVRFNEMVGYASSPVHLHSVLTGPPQSP